MSADKVPVRTSYLEIDSRDDFRPSRAVEPDFHVAQAKDPSPELSRFLFTAIGGDYYWRGRLEWTYDKWLEHLDRPELETWVASLGGNIVGYYELEFQPDKTAEILQFGLLRNYIGRGLGGLLLTHAIERAWESQASRVWLNTCTLDHPNALSHYQARGMRVFKEVTKECELPGAPPGPWQGARREPVSGQSSD